MKLTKQRLKEIIKEEFSDAILLSEGVWEEWFEIEKEYPHLWQRAASAIAFAIEEVPGQKSIKRPQAGKYAPKWAQARVGQVPTPKSAEWLQLPMAIKRAATVALEKWLKDEAPDLRHGLAHGKAAGEDPGWKEEEDFFFHGGVPDPEQRQPVRESNVKLTKQRLKEIIKEELSRVLKEGEAPDLGDVKNAREYFLKNPEVAQKLLLLLPPAVVTKIQADASALQDKALQEDDKPLWHKMMPSPSGVGVSGDAPGGSKSGRPFLQALTQTPTSGAEDAERNDAAALAMAGTLIGGALPAAMVLSVLPPALVVGGATAAVAGLMGLMASYITKNKGWRP